MIRERKKLQRFYQAFYKKGLVAVSIVSTEGSTFKKTGAIKLIHDEQNHCGFLSGGCLEQQIVEQSLRCKDQEEFAIDTRLELDLMFGSGSGCQGLLHLKVDHLSGVADWHGFQNKFLIKPHQPLVVVAGAGEDAQVLAHMFQHLEWSYQLWDDRQHYLEQCKAKKICHKKVNDTDLIHGESLELLEHDVVAFVVMSHRLSYDVDALKFSIDQKADYIGILGPKDRSLKLYEEYYNKFGVKMSFEQKDKINCPIGVEKLAYDEEGVALSIVAQLKKEIFS